MYVSYIYSLKLVLIDVKLFLLSVKAHDSLFETFLFSLILLACLVSVLHRV